MTIGFHLNPPWCLNYVLNLFLRMVKDIEENGLEMSGTAWALINGPMVQDMMDNLRATKQMAMAPLLFQMAGFTKVNGKATVPMGMEATDIMIVHAMMVSGEMTSSTVKV